MSECIYNPNKKVETSYDIQCLRNLMLPSLKRLGISEKLFNSISISFIPEEDREVGQSPCNYYREWNGIQIEPGLSMKYAIECISHEVGHAVLKTGSVKSTRVKKFARVIAEGSAFGMQHKFGKEFARERGERYIEDPQIREGMSMQYKVGHAISPIISKFGKTNIKRKIRVAPEFDFG